MKNLLVITFVIFSSLFSFAQSMKVLTPAMVNQNNAVVRGNSILAQARRAYFAKQPIPAGVRLLHIADRSIGSFEKNYSRQGISDGAFIINPKTPVFYEQATGKYAYIYCLNYFSTLQKMEKQIVQTTKIQRVEVPVKEIVYVNSPAQTQQTTTGTANVDPCTQAEANWTYVQNQYDRGLIKRNQAELAFSKLQQGNSCLAYHKPHYRNVGLKIATHGLALVAGVVVGNLTKDNRYRNISQPTTNTPVYRPGNTPNLPPANGGGDSNVGFRGGNTARMVAITQSFLN